MNNLNEIWRNWVCPLPGSIDDFVKFTGAPNKGELESMDFSKLEQLPGVKEHGLTSYGGSQDPIRGGYKWKWQFLEKTRAPYPVIGNGKTYNEAALRGLVLYWELVTLREKQSSQT